MQEFTTVSSSSYDPAALAAKLTEQSAAGWTVAGLVSNGTEVTAFLSRDVSGVSGVSDEAVSEHAPVEEPAHVQESRGEESRVEESRAEAPAAAAPYIASPYVASVPSFEPTPSTNYAPAPEPAGWAAAPEPAPMAPIIEPTPATTYTPAPTTQYTPAPAAAAPAVPAGWYADPAGRFELRYWDGGTWTEHVSRAGQQYTDPPVA